MPSIFLPSIRYIYFDFDNVLGERAENRSRLVSQRLGITDTAGLRDFYFTGFMSDAALRDEYLQLKTVDAEISFYAKLFQLFAQRSGVQVTPQQLRDAAEAFVYVPMKVKQGVMEGLAQLSHSYKLGILTNGLPSRHAEIEKAGLKAYMSTLIISSDYGIEKPDTRLYEIAAKASEHPTEALALVDDDQQNIDGALGAGYGQAILFTAEFWQQVQTIGS